MKDISLTPETFESTYALIVRSEETQRNRFETAIYTLLVISSLFAVSVFGQQALKMPTNVVRNAPAMKAPSRGGA